MNLKIHNRNLDVPENLRRLIERQSQKIRKLLPTFSGEVLDLTVSMERLPRGSQYQTSLVLTIPQRAIRVEEIEDNPTSSVLNAFVELRRRVKRFKSQLNREKLWRRQPPASTAEASVQSTRELENTINDNLEKVENYIRRELMHLSLAGNIPPGIVETQALVDEVFLEVSSQTESKPVNLSLEQWMFQMARRKIQSRISELDSHRDDPHLEETAGRQSNWDDEDLNFFQPDESLRIEDLLQDRGSMNPEELLQRDEIEQQMQKTIAKLPPSIRESFVLFALEGFNSDEVAMITGKEPREVLADVEKARESLRREGGI